MKLDKIKRKIHLLAFDQIPLVMKVLRIPAPTDEARAGFDTNGEVEVEFEAHHDELDQQSFEEDAQGEALEFEKELEIDETENGPELVGAEPNYKAKSALKNQVKQKIDALKNFKNDWANYSNSEKKEKKKKIFSIGLRVLAIIVVLWVVLDDVIFPSKKNVNPDTAQVTEINENTTQSADDLESELGNDLEAESDGGQVSEMTDSSQTETDSEMNIESEEATTNITAETETSLDTELAGADSDMSNDTEMEVSESSNDEMISDEISDEADDMKDSTEANSIDITNSDEAANTLNDLEITDFDKKGYEAVPEESKVNEVIFDEAGYKDITAGELETEVETSMTEEEKDQSPQDREIEGVSINVLRELEEKLKQKELERDQELLGKKEDLSLQGKKAPAVDFYRSGRALVYNCQASHWACVDEFSYLRCREANIVNTQKKASSTCQPYDIYVSTKDCQRAQYDFMDAEKGAASCLN